MKAGRNTTTPPLKSIFPLTTDSSALLRYTTTMKTNLDKLTGNLPLHNRYDRRNKLNPIAIRP